jgi:hypothetical protein
MPAVTMVAACIRAETGVGTGHGVRQPDVERELGGLAHRPEEQEQPAGEGHGLERLGMVGGGLVDGREGEVADRQPQQDRPEDEPTSATLFV